MKNEVKGGSFDQSCLMPPFILNISEKSSVYVPLKITRLMLVKDLAAHGMDIFLLSVILK